MAYAQEVEEYGPFASICERFNDVSHPEWHNADVETSCGGVTFVQFFNNKEKTDGVLIKTPTPILHVLTMQDYKCIVRAECNGFVCILKSLHKPPAGNKGMSHESKNDHITYWRCVLLSVLSFRYIMRQQGQLEAGGGSTRSKPEPPMHLAVVACGERLEETLTMIKSAVLFSIKQLYVHIFAEDQLHASFMEAVSGKYFSILYTSENWSAFAYCWLWISDHVLCCVYPWYQFMCCVCSSWSRGLTLFAPGSTTQFTPSASRVRTQLSGRNSSNPALLKGCFYLWVSYRLKKKKTQIWIVRLSVH